MNSYDVDRRFFGTLEEAESAKDAASDVTIVTVDEDIHGGKYELVSWDDFYRRMYDIACSLYDGGWTADDAVDIVSEYDILMSEAKQICKFIAQIAERNEKEVFENE